MDRSWTCPCGSLCTQRISTKLSRTAGLLVYRLMLVALAVSILAMLAGGRVLAHGDNLGHRPILTQAHNSQIGSLYSGHAVHHGLKQEADRISIGHRDDSRPLPCDHGAGDNPISCCAPVLLGLITSHAIGFAQPPATLFIHDARSDAWTPGLMPAPMRRPPRKA